MAQISRQNALFIATGLSSLLVAVDFTILNTGFHSLIKSTDSTLTELQWLISGFGFAFAVALLMTGRMKNLLGKRLLFYVGLGGYGVSSLFAGLSFSLGAVIFFRVLQGAFGAAIVSMAISLSMEAVSARSYGKWLAFLGIGIALGPTVGGLILSVAGWPWIFFINIPLLIICYLYCARYVPESKEKGEEKASRSLFQGRDFTVGTISYLFALSCSIVILFYLPIYLQKVLSFSFVETALVLLVLPLAALLMQRVAARHRLFTKGALTLLFFALIIGLFLQLHLTTDTHYWFLMLGLIFLGIGWGIGQGYAAPLVLSCTSAVRAVSGLLLSLVSGISSLFLVISTAIFPQGERAAGSWEEIKGGLDEIGKFFYYFPEIFSGDTSGWASATELGEITNVSFVGGYHAVVVFLLLLVVLGALFSYYKIRVKRT